MIVVDLNLLIYAYNSSAPEHKSAKKWFEQQINSGQIIGIPWVVLLGFIRLLTGTKVVETPFRTNDLLSIIDDWFKFSNIQLLEQSYESYKILRSLMIDNSLSGASTTDASIAALTIAYNGKLATNDTDFFRFKSLALINPLE